MSSTSIHKKSSNKEPMVDFNTSTIETNKNDDSPIDDNDNDHVHVDETQKEETHEFWGKNPNVLFHLTYIFEIFPVSSMGYEQKLNAVSRLVILLTIVFYILFKSYRSFMFGILTLGAIWAMYYAQTKKTQKKVRFQEGFEGTSDVVKDFLKERGLSDALFSKSTAENPLQNVLLTDYDNPTDKRPAPASYTQESQSAILDHTKSMIDSINPEQPKISKKLFRSLEDNLAFEQSMRPFYSTANTTIPNDQGAFADFCYGSMVSCKEGNPFACTKQMASRHTNI